MKNKKSSKPKNETSSVFQNLKVSIEGWGILFHAIYILCSTKKKTSQIYNLFHLFGHIQHRSYKTPKIRLSIMSWFELEC